MKLLILLLLLPLGCQSLTEGSIFDDNITPSVLDGAATCVNITNTITKIVPNNTIIHNRTIEYINITLPCLDNCTYTAKSVISVIRELKACEYRERTILNNSDCVWTLDKCNRTLNKTMNKIEEIRKVIK